MLPSRRRRQALARKLDPDRLIDPNFHGTYLREMHQSIIDMDRQGHQLLNVLQSDVERVIRDLSNCLLFPNNPGNDLNGQMQKFNVVAALLQQIQQHLKRDMKKTRESGEEVVKI